MSSKGWIFLGLFVGSTAGGYVPVLFGSSFFSLSSAFFSLIGGIIGIWLGLKVNRMIG